MTEEVEESEDDDWKDDILKKFESKFAHHFCDICGLKAGSRCGGCKMARYCSREHQVEDWRLGHDLECKAYQKGTRLPEKRKSPSLFKEFEIETEEENVDEEEEDEEDGGSSVDDKKELIQLYEAKFANREIAPDPEEGVEEEDLEKKVFLDFQKKTKKHPDQVLRYSRGNQNALVWVSAQNKPETIPPCENCGANRIFEFQILPQLLYYLGVHKETTTASLDWGVLVAYTCQNSCSPKSEQAYLPEFLWVQNIPAPEKAPEEVPEETAQEG